ncbi:hypothetical protein HYPSUDRAFT_74623 [Hypholoma sublateritium FD-334 SS-4]|uniref:Caprin-1 dimerization domain-containing protein n=1 Tax=Hypholoma sublateritium (strain FD-334 SS-4) TaxID=945553 RepID=A0A0D2MU91_HYPSF|nr:hypothetical protein HYPSUDRAFT_74623 [Hypholoma sublateritium FD-334 SS-4]
MSDTPAAPVAPRIVPGAPPPTAPAPKKNKRSRKPKKKAEDEALVEGDAASAQGTVEAPEPRAPTPVPEIIEQIEIPEISAAEEDVLLKPSPIMKLVHKRYQVNARKIYRITPYVSMDSAKLNDDQKRSLKSLPTLEAVQKELGEVKTAIEAHEAELAQELANKRQEVAKAEKARIYRAVLDAQAILETKTMTILDLLRLRSLVDAGAHDVSNIADAERAALFSVTDVLSSDDSEGKQAAVNALFSGREIHGISPSQLIEIVTLAFNPPRAPTPQEEPVEEEQPHEEVHIETETEAPIIGIPSTTMSGSLSFIQASEIETPSFDEDVEWVEKSDAAGHEEPAVNGHATQEAEPSVATEAPNSTIDWAADDEGGLPSIAGLHAEFGTSGSATPAEGVEHTHAPAATEANGHVEEATGPVEEDDGFTQARGGRGRGGRGFRGGERGRGGFRGGERGGFRGGRGGERGGFRGGERGGFRGGEGSERGGFRGGEGGERGSFRGGDRGGFRGGFRGNGERGGHAGRGNGEWRGDGERRGGRGRGRGDRGGGHAHSTPPPAAASAAV